MLSMLWYFKKYFDLFGTGCLIRSYIIATSITEREREKDRERETHTRTHTQTHIQRERRERDKLLTKKGGVRSKKIYGEGCVVLHRPQTFVIRPLITKPPQMCTN